MTGTVPLLSTVFLVLAVLTVSLVASTRGRVRELVFLAANFVALITIFLGWRGTLSTMIFILAGWIVVQLAVRFQRWGLILGVAGLVGLFAWMRNYAFLQVLLPASLTTSIFATLGLSFLLFKILHVAIDARGGAAGPISPLLFLNYCLNFTTFAMGPIQRIQDYRSQWTGESTALPESLSAYLDAINRILFGLFRIYVLGALLQPYIMTYTSGTESAPISTALVSIYAFWFFLYFNFAGYCDVAIGLGSLLGVRPPENFNKPFLARNISDFWQRQHRSLTLWLTDYVFTPTMRSTMRRGFLAHHRTLAPAFAIFVTMLVSGLWHGTTVGFLLFGLAHGAFLVLYYFWDLVLTRQFGRARIAAWRKNPVVAAGGVFLTFNATAFAFVFFQLGARKSLELLLNVIS